MSKTKKAFEGSSLDFLRGLKVAFKGPILLFVLLTLVYISCSQTISSNTPTRTLFDEIYTGYQEINYVAGQRIYRITVKFPKVQQYFTSLYVRDIYNYKGQPPLPNQTYNLRQASFNPKLQQWGFNFTLSQQTWESSLLITLEIGQGVSFKKMIIGYLITRDPNFLVGHSNPIREKCNSVCPQVRQWPVSMIIRSPPTGSIFVPFIIGLKAKAPQPSINFVNVNSEALNSTHRILHLNMLIESIYPIEEIIFSYISHSNVNAKYALLIYPNFDPNRRDDGAFYGVVEVNGYIEASKLERQPEFFEVIGVALRRQFYLQQTRNTTKNIR